MRVPSVLLAACLLLFTSLHAEDFSAWSGHGSVWLLTDKEGADLPATAVVKEFPIVMRLHGDTFPFAAAQADGADLRVTDASGRLLALEIESWDKVAGEAVVWVRVPEIRGATRQELKLHWGNALAKPVSDGTKVFSRDNGYLSVWHMGKEVKDSAGTLTSKVVGTKPVAGVVGEARSFAGKEGIFGGDKITGYPTDASSHTTSAWIRPTRSNSTIIAWGNEAGGRGSKVRFQLRAPQRLHIDSNFSDVDGPFPLAGGPFPPSWHYVAHTYDKNDGRLYVDGMVVGKASPTLNIKSPARLWIGGWFNEYSYEGQMDEVRVSSVARSPEWLKLEYYNQIDSERNPVGHVVTQGGEFSLTAERVELSQGETAHLRANFPGALAVRWFRLNQGPAEDVGRARLDVDLDPVAFNLPEAGDRLKHTFILRAVMPTGVMEKSIDIFWKRIYPNPRLEVDAPASWDGRTELRLKVRDVNGDKLKALGDNERPFTWSTSGVPVVSEFDGDTLILKRAMGAGKLHVFGSSFSRKSGVGYLRESVIQVAEQPLDPWLARPEPTEELPMDGQFYAREGDGLGRLYCKGALAAEAKQVTLKLYADDKLVEEATQVPQAGKGYRFVQTLKPGLIRYRVELLADGKPVHAASDLVCGDAYIIEGQSNAVATDFGKENPLQPNPWVRSFGAMDGSPPGCRLKLWGPAEARAPGGKLQVGFWGMELGRRLVESQHIPICLLNGAVGGTRIDQHQRDAADPTNPTTIYGRLLWRVRAAGLEHGIRGILWHQGENDQGADGPDGTYGYVNYRKYFDRMAASWRQDYPNAQRLHLFQIWPKSCAMGINGSDNDLREEQRKLKSAYAHLDIMPTLGIRPPGGCHFPAAGYAEFAKLMVPLIERDHYGVKNIQSVSAPNILDVERVGAKKDTLVLTFDQPIVWRDELAGELSFSKYDLSAAEMRPVSIKVIGGDARGATLTLRLSEGLPDNGLIHYLDSKNWSQDRLLMGANGIPALTFRSVPIR